MSEPFKRTPPNGEAGLLTTTCRFDADLLERIETEAHRLGVSKSEVVRAHVREGLERRAAERAVTGDLAAQEERIARLERLVRALARQQFHRP